jgi:hypothetical protein
MPRTSLTARVPERVILQQSIPVYTARAIALLNIVTDTKYYYNLLRY